MIVNCPNCQAKFKLPDDKIGATGAKLRCSKCRQVFHIDPVEQPKPGGLTDFDFPEDLAPSPASASPVAPAQTERGESVSRPSAKASLPDDEPPDLFHSESYEAPASAKRHKRDVDEQEEQEEERDTGPVKPGFSLQDVADIPLPGSQPSKERRRRVLILGGVMDFQQTSPGLWILARLNALRAWTTGISFGDQGQFFRREALALMGGFPAMALMEDVELALRLRAVGETVLLGGGLTVSGRRWIGTGFGGKVAGVLRLFIGYLAERRLGLSDPTGWRYYRLYYGPLPHQTEE